MRYLFTVFLIVLSWCSYSQKEQLNPRSIDLGILADHVHDRVNFVRDSIGLVPFIKDNELETAATIQSKYCLSVHKLTHFHKKNKLRTVGDRVLHSNGVHNTVSENLVKYRLINEWTYDLLTKDIVQKWVNSPGHFKNMINNSFRRSGIVFMMDFKDNTLYGTQVFGSTPVSFNGIKSPANSYFVRSDKGPLKECSECIKALDTIYDFGFNVQGRSVFITMGDKKHFKKVFKKATFAADIILRHQFDCGEPNVLHSSVFHDGYLTKPWTAKKILRNNLATDGSLVTEIAFLPFEIVEQFEANLVLAHKRMGVKHQRHCVNVIPSAAYGYDLKLLPHTLLADTISDVNSFLLKRKLEFTIPFEKDKYTYDSSDVKHMTDSVSLDKYEIKEIRVLAFASVEGSKEHNKELQEKRAQSILSAFQTYQMNTIKEKVGTRENWKEFKRDVKKTEFSYLLKLKKDSIKSILRNPSVYNELDALLSNHRKAIISVKAIERIDSTRLPGDILSDYRSLLKSDTKNVRSLYRLQGLVYAYVLKGQLSLKDVRLITLPKRKRFIKLWLNRVALFYLKNGVKPEIEELLELDSLAQDAPLVRFDIHGLIVERWYENPYLNELPLKQILKNTALLYKKKKITSGEYYKMMLNYHLSAANHFNIYHEYEKEHKSVNYVFQHFYKATLTEYDALVLANFLVYHNEYKKATKLLKPYSDKRSVSDDLLFYYLSIALFEKSIEKSTGFDQKMKRALERDEDRFCKLFGYPAVTFQLLRNPVLKDYYCGNCDSKHQESDKKSIIGEEDLNPHLIDADSFGD